MDEVLAANLSYAERFFLIRLMVDQLRQEIWAIDYWVSIASICRIHGDITTARDVRDAAKRNITKTIGYIFDVVLSNRLAALAFIEEGERDVDLDDLENYPGRDAILKEITPGKVESLEEMQKRSILPIVRMGKKVSRNRVIQEWFKRIQAGESLRRKHVTQSE
jgi:hypothetical protein